MIRVLTELPEPFPKLAERLLNAFKSMEDPAEMYVFAKSFWELIGQKPDKALVKYVSECLVRWYDVVHEQLFGSKKALGAVATPESESESESEEGGEGEEEEEEEEEGEEVESPEVPAGAP
jgi:ribosomal protein L12E/L44/L45/RPP1/RPP2